MSAGKALEFAKKWGPIGIITHYTVSLSLLGIIYFAVHARKDDFMPYMPAYVPKTGTLFRLFEIIII